MTTAHLHGAVELVDSLRVVVFRGPQRTQRSRQCFLVDVVGRERATNTEET